MNDAIQSLIRAILKIGGGYLVSKGYADGNTVEIIGAGLAALFGVIWGVMHRKEPAPAPTPTPTPTQTTP